MAAEQSDVLVIGGGPGGISAASHVALRGKSVTIINDGPLMGYGIDGAFRTKAAFEITREHIHARFLRNVFGEIPDLDLSRVRGGIDLSASELTSMLEHRLSRLGVRLVEGHASFLDDHRVTTGSAEYTADSIIIATGTRPRLLPGMKPDGNRVLTSDEATILDRNPESIAILGAGVIGCEFASMFGALGTRVRLVDTRPAIMANEDPDVSEFLRRSFAARGIEIISSSRFESMEVGDDVVTTTLTTGEVESELVLFAIGRSPCSDGLGLEAAGIELDAHGFISVDSTMRTSVPHIFAVGDIGVRSVPTDHSLVHVAEAEGRTAAAEILGKPCVQSMNHIPYIVFTVPMLAGAGITETFAREKYGDVRVGKYPYARNHRAHALQPPVGFVKLIVAPKGDDRILGVRVVGPGADGIVGAASIIIERELPYTYLLESIFPHPSLLECLKGAAHIVAEDALKYEEGEEISLADL